MRDRGNLVFWLHDSTKKTVNSVWEFTVFSWSRGAKKLNFQAPTFPHPTTQVLLPSYLEELRNAAKFADSVLHYQEGTLLP